MEPGELEAAQATGFRCVPSRMQIEKGDLVVGRYSVLPFFRETADDIEYIGAKLINGKREHFYIADMRNWVEDLRELTPETWFRLEDVPLGEPGPFFLKGETNSRKDRFATHCFAKTRADIDVVYERLSTDGLIGQAGDKGQDIYVRRYIPLVTYATGIQELPITKEYRFFIAKEQILTGAYYWSHWGDTCLEADPNWKEPEVTEVPESFLREAIRRIGGKAVFYALDVAQDVTGRWWVIEVNDGQMSGLSGNKPEVLYSRLAEVLC
jgi:hypothetical protein